MSRVIASVVALAVAAATLVALPMSAQAAITTELELSAPAGYYEGNRVNLEATSTVPLDGIGTLEYRSPGGDWRTAGSPARFSDGLAIVAVKPSGTREYRVSIAGATSNPVTLTPIEDGVVLTAPSTFLVGDSVVLTAERGRHANGVGTLAVRTGVAWEPADEPVVFVDGTATIAVAPTTDVEYRVSFDGFTSNIAALAAGSVAPADPGVATAVTLDGDGLFRDGEWAALAASLDAPLDGAGSVWVKPDGGSWAETDATARFVDGEAVVAVLPTGPAEYRVDFDGVQSNAVAFAAAPEGLVLTAPATFVKGDWVALTMETNTHANGKGRLFERRPGRSWVRSDVRAVVIDGTAYMLVKPKGERDYRVRFGGEYSNTVSLEREYAVASLSAPETYAEGTSVEMQAALSADVSGIGKAQVRKVGGRWKSLSDPVMFVNGVAEFEVSPSGTKEYRVRFGPAKSNVIRLSPGGVPTSFTFSGSGYGHGVGMPQYGAKALAVDGETADEILEYYYTGSSVETLPVVLPGGQDPDGDEVVKVQVFGSYSDSTTAARVKIRSVGGDGQWRALFYDSSYDPIMDGGSQRSLAGDESTRIDLSRSGSTITATAGSTSKTGNIIEIQWESTTYYQPGSTEVTYADILTTSNAQATHGDYRHGMLTVRVANSRLNISNVLKFNTEYLYGIAEVPSSWPEEVLKAQAIAARNYAGAKRTRSSSCDCHVYDDTRSQYFSGWKKESEAGYGDRWVAAVDATTSDGGDSGEFLTYGAGGLDRLVQAYYFSSSGGQTENSEDIWVSALSYTRSVPDPWSISAEAGNPYASWGTTVSQAKAKQVFGLADVVDIRVVKRTSGAGTAAVTILEATSSSGATSRITGAENIRIKLGLKSAWIWTITGNG